MAGWRCPVVAGATAAPANEREPARDEPPRSFPLGPFRIGRGYAQPRTRTIARMMKITVCTEWTMMPIHALRNRRDGQA